MNSPGVALGVTSVRPTTEPSFFFRGLLFPTTTTLSFICILHYSQENNTKS